MIWESKPSLNRKYSLLLNAELWVCCGQVGTGNSAPVVGITPAMVTLSEIKFRLLLLGGSNRGADTTSSRIRIDSNFFFQINRRFPAQDRANAIDTTKTTIDCANTQMHLIYAFR